MDDATLRARLWDGFAGLQALLGSHARDGSVVQAQGVVASLVPNAQDSPTLNAAVATDPRQAIEALPRLAERYADARIRRWGIWIDPDAHATEALLSAGLMMTSSSPGMGAALDELPLAATRNNHVTPADLSTVGRVNDVAYGNPDARLERTLTTLPEGLLHAFRVDHRHQPASVALALHHGHDCGVFFVATTPKARRKGLATTVMQRTLDNARAHGCTSTTLQATPAGERLYTALGYRMLGDMQLWERRR
jgi:GNAT superfamily N-acetyltransferase